MKKALNLWVMIIVLGLTSCARQEQTARLKVFNPLPETAHGSGRNEGIAMDVNAAAQKSKEETQYFDGSGKLFAQQDRAQMVQKSASGGINLSFTNVDIAVVVDAVLKDLMAVPYAIDPNVRGNISLETTGAVDKMAVFNALETTLKLKGIALVPTGGGYKVVPLALAPKAIAGFTGVRPSSSDLPGFAVQLVPLAYTSPTEMRRVLEPFAPKGGIVKIDEARKLMILAGTSQELASMRQVIATFDLDWMEGMSFALYDLQFVESDVIAKELLEIFGDADSPIAGAVRLIPIKRLNKLLGISAQPAYLRQVETWVNRLDVGDSSPGRRIYVYHVQNGKATDMASSLSTILGTSQYGNGGSNGGTSGSGGSGVTTTGSGLGGTSSSRPQQASSRTSGRNSQSNNNLRGNSALGAANGPSGGTSDIRIVPNEENNLLLIMASPSEYSVIVSALKQMDLAPRQVLIEAALAEVTLTDELRYGVSWIFENNSNSVSLASSGGGPTQAFPGFSYAYSGLSNVRAVLNALEGMTDVNVVSYPKIMALNNHSATMQIGDEVPVPTQSAVGTSNSDAPIVNSIEYRETGVILTVTPRINEGGLVIMEITQEISDVVETTSSGIDAPTIQQRKFESTVAVQSGQTIALGGLIRQTQSLNKSGVPYLQRIPLLGAVFRNTNIVERRTELIVLITPRVLRDVTETREVMDYLRDTFKTVLPPRDKAASE